MTQTSFTSQRIIVTGAKGQLGQAIQHLLGSQATYLAQEDLDIGNEQAVQSYFADAHHENTLIINCAAYTAVDRAEDELQLANDVNHLGAGFLAKYGRNIIHVSTDYVFDGQANTPYREDMPVNPRSVYGTTKEQGEQAVLKAASTAIVIRTAWLYSASGNNFLNTMYRLGQERESLNVVYDQVGSPTNVADLAQAIVAIIPKIQKGQKEIYHYTNEGVCSWYDFAVEIMAQAQLPCQVFPILSAQYPTKAKRPTYSVLDKAKIKQDFRLTINYWRKALASAMREKK